MSIVKYIQCDICDKKITGMRKTFRGHYSFGEIPEHVCWDCWTEMMKFVEQKKNEKMTKQRRTWHERRESH